MPDNRKMRQFKSGATRDSDDDKLDYEGFRHPLVEQCFAEYMHRHRTQRDGKKRASDNWQKGMPMSTCIKSAWRHFMDWWLEFRGFPSRDGLLDALCGILFNVHVAILGILTAPKKGKKKGGKHGKARTR